jgi:Holliday junction DNA helicase RuvA
MIARLEGSIIDVSADRLILDVNGVGYEIFPVGGLYQKGSRQAFWIYDHIREDRRDLYGFEDKAAKELFLAVTSVSGIGAKLAQGMLSAHTPEVITRHILDGDLTFLTSLSGIGKKTAQKLVLELKGVLVEEDDAPAAVNSDALEALVSLGYAKKEAMAALDGQQGDSVEDLIKAALKSLSK